MTNVSDEKKAGIAEFRQHRKRIEDFFKSAQCGDINQFLDAIRAIQAAESAETSDILTEIRDANHRTVAHFAASRGRLKVLKYIHDKAPKSLELKDKDGSTPLYLAAKENEFKAVKFLLAAKIDVNIANNYQITPLHEAALNGSIRSCTALIESGANLEAMTENGTPLHYAVSEDREKTVGILLAHGANGNAMNKDGITPIMLACILQKQNIAKRLIHAQIDLTCTAMNGLTALHIAAEMDLMDVIQEALLTRRENAIEALNMRSTDAQQLPLQLAAAEKHEEIMDLIRPLTKGFENVQIKDLIQAEQSKTVAEDKVETVDKANDEKYKKPLPEDASIQTPKLETPLQVQDLEKVNVLKENGNRAFLSQKYEEAIALYSEAIAINPTDHFLYSNRSAAYLRANQAQSGLYDATLAKKLKPDFSKAQFRQGQCYEALEMYEEAACAYWSAVQLEPNDKTLSKRFKECIARGRAKHLSKTV